MATKEELANENMELKGRVATLEAQIAEGKDDATKAYVEGLEAKIAELEGKLSADAADAAMAEPVETLEAALRRAMGDDAYNDALLALADEDDVDVEDLDAESAAVRVLEAVLSVPDEQPETQPGRDAKDDRIDMLVADVARLEIERNDARNEVERLKGRLRDAGTLHGSIDNLKMPG